MVIKQIFAYLCCYLEYLRVAAEKPPEEWWLWMTTHGWKTALLLFPQDKISRLMQG